VVGAVVGAAALGAAVAGAAVALVGTAAFGAAVVGGTVVGLTFGAAVGAMVAAGADAPDVLVVEPHAATSDNRLIKANKLISRYMLSPNVRQRFVTEISLVA
jgi:hypothetical protein